MAWDMRQNSSIWVMHSSHLHSKAASSNSPSFPWPQQAGLLAALPALPPCLPAFPPKIEPIPSQR